MNLTLRLFDELRANTRISQKAKERFANPRAYFLMRQREEEKVILSGFGYAFFEESDLADIQDMQINSKIPYPFCEKTLMMVLIESLKSYVDAGKEDDPRSIVLHEKYLQLKTKVSAEIPFEEGDGFADYVDSKTERQEFEEARETGKICIRCGSNDVHSKGAEWRCFDCGKRFRKR